MEYPSIDMNLLSMNDKCNLMKTIVESVREEINFAARVLASNCASIDSMTEFVKSTPSHSEGTT